MVSALYSESHSRYWFQGLICPGYQSQSYLVSSHQGGGVSYTFPCLGQAFCSLDHWFVDAESSCSPWLSLYPRFALILELWHIEFWLCECSPLFGL